MEPIVTNNKKPNMLEKKWLSTALNVRSQGSGTETIVFAHGYGTDQSIWDKITPSFVENYKVVLFDWPFSGAVNDPTLYDPFKYSSLEAFADELVTLMDQMDLKAVTFVGHSMSGMIGCLASIKRPELFKRLILLCASPRYINTEDYEGGFTSSDIEQLLKEIEFNYENWVSAFSLLVVDPNDEPSVHKFKECLKKMRAEVPASLAKTVFYSDYRDILEKVETPCTIIQTSADIVVPYNVAVYMENKIKGKVTLEVVDTKGHFPQLTAWLQLVDVLKGVLG
ncbi:strigolactone esterase D14 [Cajanus cajan]|uniref:Sigma factor sigB regulation protein rsbQ n=1 Tax=Cajanus cajan TaxID=3821 RepID=A0A151S383_CAJCA|nr:strigolactone esterase D14 [Cajanus cajan]KYP49295.1 Sigma factor sigB regulation protein rsbQ [Cajanus cajan]